MEEEKDDFSESASGVKISITRASWSGDEEESGNREQSATHEDEIDNMLNEEEEKEQLAEEREDSSRSGASGGDDGPEASTNAENGEEGVSQAFERSVSISESNREDASEDRDDKSEALASSPQVEVVGDRVLIERDGKFELVDVKEIKAEYFEMLGLSVDDKLKTSVEEEPPSEVNDSVSSETSETRNKSTDKKTRPKTTTLDELLRRNQKNETPQKSRSKSAKTRSSFSRRDDFAHIKSPYGMTEQQIEIKKKREEAIARRKREEDERRREEIRRQREDAERAFEVLSSHI